MSAQNPVSTYRVHLRRDTRWDANPASEQPLEEVLVTCTLSARLGSLSDVIVQQHPRWSDGCFIVESVEQVSQ